MLLRLMRLDLAKVGVVGSNPITRSKFSVGKSERYERAAQGGPSLLVLTFLGLKKCKHYVSS